ncbi:BrnA antitoxin family protein [bacterium]|nr:BrnA antitoxin family protein [bacterium]
MTKKIPDFKSEKEEKEFWKTHDVREYINWNNAEPFVKRVFKNKKTETELLKELKQKITGD